MSVTRAETVEEWEWHRGERQQHSWNTPVTYRWIHYEGGFNSEADAHAAAKRYGDDTAVNQRKSGSYLAPLVYRVNHVITQRTYGEPTTYPEPEAADA